MLLEKPVVFKAIAWKAIVWKADAGKPVVFKALYLRRLLWKADGIFELQSGILEYRVDSMGIIRYDFYK